MGKVILEMSVSVDGFVAGPNIGPAEPTARRSTSTGAFVIGRKTFDLGEQPWGEDGTFGVPHFVVTHRDRDLMLIKGPTTFTFVTEGVQSAVKQALAAAGDKDVVVLGGASLARQCLRAGLLDELWLHVVPVLLGRGTRLFDDTGLRIELGRTECVETAAATHLRFRVLG